EELASCLGAIVEDETGRYLRFTLTGVQTASVLPDGAASTLRRHEVAEILGDGKDVVIDEDFRVNRGPAPSELPAPQTIAPGFHARLVAQDDGRIVLRYAGTSGLGVVDIAIARGDLPAGATPDDYHQAFVQPAIDAGAAADAAREDLTVAVGDKLTLAD